MTSNTHKQKKYPVPLQSDYRTWPLQEKEKHFLFHEGNYFSHFFLALSISLYESVYGCDTTVCVFSFLYALFSVLMNGEKKVDYIVRSLISRLSSLPRFHRSSFIFPNIRMNKASCLGTANGAIYEVELEYCPWDVYGFNSPLALLGHDKRSSWSRQVYIQDTDDECNFFLYCSFCVLFPFILPRFFSSNLLLTKHPRHKVLSTVCECVWHSFRLRNKGGLTWRVEFDWDLIAVTH